MRTRVILLLGLLASSAIFGLRWAAHRAETAPLEETGTPPPPTAARQAPGLKRGDRLPDVRLTDQDGNALRTSDFRGKVLVIGFIYTHCNLPSMCPSVTAKIIETRDRLKNTGKEGAGYLIVSFDPGRDGAERLTEYASRYTTDLSSIRFASAAAEDVHVLARALNTYYREETTGVFEHNIAVSIVDREGVLRDDLFGTEWKVEELVRAVEGMLQ